MLSLDVPGVKFNPYRKISTNVYFQQVQEKQEVAVTNLDHVSNLDIDRVPPFVRQTSLVCTLGESWNNKTDMEYMIKHGMNILRLSTAKHTRQQIIEAIKLVRLVEEEHGHSPVVAVALDISPQPARIGLINGEEKGQLSLNDGDKVILTSNDVYKNNSNASHLWFDISKFPKSLKMIKEGDRLFLGDGTIKFIVRYVEIDQITCLVEQGGVLLSSKRLRCANDKHLEKVLTEQYYSDLQFAVDAKVDFVFTSMSHTADLLTKAKSVLNPEMSLFAKVDTRESYENLDKIMKVCEGIIIGRGELGLEFPPTRIFALQKNIIARCNVYKKPVFVIRQLLKSMRFNARPTRAEVSDVANAVMDGADGLILTAETSRSLHPAKALKALHNTCREAETAIFHTSVRNDLKMARDEYGVHFLDATATASFSAVEASDIAGAAAIIVVTYSGKSASAIAMCRPSVPVIAVMRTPELARRQHASRGVHPFVCQIEDSEDWAEDMDKRINSAIDHAKRRKFLKEGDYIVIVTGWESGPGHTNTVRIHQVPKAGSILHVVSSRNIFANE